MADANSRDKLIADARASLRVFLEKVKKLSPDDFDLGLDGLEDWLENGTTSGEL